MNSQETAIHRITREQRPMTILCMGIVLGIVQRSDTADMEHHLTFLSASIFSTDASPSPLTPHGPKCHL